MAGLINISSGTPSDQPSTDKKKKKKPDLPIIAIKNTADYQRMKLERLFANPEKPVVIPTAKPRDKNLPPPPEFVRNVMGSSAGAGSGEFHVYRHLRRKEYARQKGIVEKSRVEQLDEDFQNKLEQNKKDAEMKTAKKRAKRLRQKQKLKTKKPRTQNSANPTTGSTDDSNNSDSEDDTNGDTSTKPSNGNNSNGNNGSAGQKNGHHNTTLSNKPQRVVTTYSSPMSQVQPPDVVTSSDSD